MPVSVSRFGKDDKLTSIWEPGNPAEVGSPEVETGLLNISAPVNWDWVADRDTAFPHYAMELTDLISSPPEDLPIPLMRLSSYAGSPPLHTGVESSPLVTNTPLGYTLHVEHGLLHMNLADWQPEQGDLGVSWSPTVAFSGSSTQQIVGERTDVTMNYLAMLVADFKSSEVHEFAQLGGALFKVETEDSWKLPDGGYRGTYVICYTAASLVVYKYNEGGGTYLAELAVDHNFYGTTNYVGVCVRLTAEGTRKLQIFIDGEQVAEIVDSTITKLGACPYIRGVTSLDFWFGDICAGNVPQDDTYPPVPAKAIYKMPSEIEASPGIIDSFYPETGKWYIPPAEVVGASSAAEAIALPVSLVPSATPRGIFAEFYNWKDAMTAQTFFPGNAGAHLFAKFDYLTDPEVSDSLLGVSALIVHNCYHRLEAPYTLGMNRYYQAAVQQSHVCLADKEGGGDSFAPYDDAKLELYMYNGTDLIRGVCAEGFKSSGNNPYAVSGANPSAIQMPVNSQMRLACDVIDLLPDSVDPTANNKELLATYTYKPSALTNEAYDFDHYVANISTFVFHAGSAGIRTKDSLEAPVYAGAPTCQLPMSCANYPAMVQAGTATADPTYPDERIFIDGIQVCNSLYTQLFTLSIGDSDWEWTVQVEDFCDRIGTGILPDPFLYGPRRLRVTLHMIGSEGLGRAGVYDAAQLNPLVKSKIQLRLFRPDWVLPQWDTELVVASYSLNVIGQIGEQDMGTWEANADLVFETPYVQPSLETPPERLFMDVGQVYEIQIFDPGTAPELKFFA